MTDYPLTYWSPSHPDRVGKRCRVAKYSRADGFVNAGNYREVTFEFEDGVQLVAQQRFAQRRPMTVKRGPVMSERRER